MIRRGTEEASVLFVVTLSSFLVPFLAAALNLALPPMGRDLSMDAVVLGWVVTAFLLAAAVCLLPSGRLADIHGRKRVFLWGMIVYTLGSLLCAAAASVTVLVLGRVISGAGAAMGFATGTAMLMSVVPAEERGRALGWNVAAVYMGLSLGPVVGGIITHDLGWRWIFVATAAGGAVAAIFTIVKVKGEWAEARGEAFDAVGSAILAISLVALMYGFTRLPGVLGVVLVALSALAFAVFVRWEVNCRSPVFDIRLFVGNSVFAFSNVATLINYAATAGVAFLLSLHLQYTNGLSPQQAGMILIAQPAVMAVFSPLAGRLSDRVDAGRLASLGMAITAAGLAIFCALRLDSSRSFVVTGLAVLGFGFSLFSSPNTNAVMSSVPRRHYGIASGTLATMRLIGQMLSMGIVMLVMATFVGRVQITPESHPGLLKAERAAFAVLALLCVLGVFASAVRGRIDPNGIGNPAGDRTEGG